MKTIIAIIIVLLIGLGIWYATKGDDIDNQEAAAVGALNVDGDETPDTGADTDTGEFEDKG
ncbi:MAG: hypothetical protein Q7R67_02695 [bacterium]|nr:hypothetical protein [bacterium]